MRLPHSPFNPRRWLPSPPPRFVAPLLLLAACVLAFGITIPWLGLYADDWPFAYVNHNAGLRGVVDFISWVRPVAAWVFGAAAALVGTHFWVAHALLLALRWGASMLFWVMLRRAWPENPRLALWAALLFAVYPAFKQQPLALEYVPHFLALMLLFGSLWGSLRLAGGLPGDQSLTRRAAAALLALAWLGSLQVFILEYFVGLEALRPALLYVAYRRANSPKQAALKALRGWLPFLPVLAGFLLWRVFVLGFPSYQPVLVSGLGSSPLAALRDLAKTMLHDVFTAGLAAWAQPFWSIPRGRALLAWGALVGVLFAGFAAALSWGEVAPASPGHGLAENRSARVHLPPSLEYIALGILALLAAGWPFWITHIPLSLDFPWDRASLAFMVGAALLAAGILGVVGTHRYIAPLLLAAMLAFSIGLHFQNANEYRKESALLNGFYWQLTWRAPGLQPGTAIILDQPPFNYHVDKFLAPLVNWTYAPGSNSLDTPYTLLDFHKLWGKSLPPKTPADPIQASYGTLHFTGDASRLLLVVYDPPGCLRVLTPAAETHLLLSPELKQSLALTNLAQIQTSPPTAAKPPGFLGAEPAHNWCYAFEKAELAAQTGDFQAAARLGDEAYAAGFAPKQPTEHLVFVYAYAKLGRWQDALLRSQAAASTGEFARRAACAAWQRIGAEIDAAQARQAEVALGCP